MHRFICRKYEKSDRVLIKSNINRELRVTKQDKEGNKTLKYAIRA